MSHEQLELRVAWQHHVGRTVDADAAYESVVARYRDTARRYHDIRHLTWVVRHALGLAVGRPVTDLGALVAAAFYHDAIYDVRARDNERASAELGRAQMVRLGWPADRADRVAALVLATEHLAGEGAGPAGTDLDTAILVAADLAVLAADPTSYGDYVRNIRAEYAHLSDAEWTVGRRAVIDHFLACDRLFPDVLELSSWERRARANLTAERASLD